MLVTALLTRRGGVSTGNRLLAGALVAMMSYLGRQLALKILG